MTGRETVSATVGDRIPSVNEAPEQRTSPRPTRAEGSEIQDELEEPVAQRGSISVSNAAKCPFGNCLGAGSTGG